MHNFGMVAVAPEVQEALAEGRAVVALESTIISHGMPFPKNLETAICVEELVREQGATPATVAVIDGKICVGLSHVQLEMVAESKGTHTFHKLTKVDLPYAVMRKMCGATTVAATIFCAELAGIGVMATGGIGGAHRGCELSFDISADLDQLARSSLAVVCSGVKSILDIGKTLELLETLQVPVIGYQSKEMPAFFSKDSGHQVNMTCNTPQEVADFMNSYWHLKMPGAALIAVPPPSEFAVPYVEMEAYIDQALAMAALKAITGKAVTPFLLATIDKLSAGRSLAVNQALIKNNAKIAAEIAQCLTLNGSGLH